jgi:hypothetical protein
VAQFTHRNTQPGANDMTPSYAVMNKETGQLFAGFDADQQPVWTDDERKARTYSDKRDAHGQALLFACFDIKTQKKPVAL